MFSRPGPSITMSHIADTLATVKEIDVTYFIRLSLWFVLIFLVFVQYPFFFCSRTPHPCLLCRTAYNSHLLLVVRVWAGCFHIEGMWGWYMGGVVRGGASNDNSSMKF